EKPANGQQLNKSKAEPVLGEHDPALSMPLSIPGISKAKVQAVQLKLNNSMKKNILRQLIMLSKRLFYVFLGQVFLCTVLLANTGNAQRKTIEEVKVTLNLQEKTLLQFFKQVEAGTDFMFTYSDDLVDLRQKVTVEESNQSLYKVLEAVSRQTLLHFVQVNENIHVKAGITNQERAVEIAQVQDVTISGTVTDANGEPMPGVTISVSGTTIGTATDLNGRYSLSVPEGATLVFSFIGFETQSIAIGDQSVIDLTLTEDIDSLDEVVVTAFGMEREKKALTYSVQELDGESLTAVGNANFTNSLQGKVAGVNVW